MCLVKSKGAIIVSQLKRPIFFKSSRSRTVLSADCMWVYSVFLQFPPSVPIDTCRGGRCPGSRPDLLTLLCFYWDITERRTQREIQTPAAFFCVQEEEGTLYFSPHVWDTAVFSWRFSLLAFIPLIFSFLSEECECLCVCVHKGLCIRVCVFLHIGGFKVFLCVCLHCDIFMVCIVV